MLPSSGNKEASTLASSIVIGGVDGGQKEFEVEQFPVDSGIVVIVRRQGAETLEVPDLRSDHISPLRVGDCPGGIWMRFRRRYDDGPFFMNHECSFPTFTVLRSAASRDQFADSVDILNHNSSQSTPVKRPPLRANSRAHRFPRLHGMIASPGMSETALIPPVI